MAVGSRDGPAGESSAVMFTRMSDATAEEVAALSQSAGIFDRGVGREPCSSLEVTK